MSDVNDPLAAERAAARYVTGLALGVLAVALGWFAYIDAPISDRVMSWVACAVAAGLVAALAGLWAYALTLPAPAAAAVPRSVLRLRRLAMLALAVVLVLLAMAMVATLNVRGEGSGDDADDTAVAV